MFVIFGDKAIKAERITEVEFEAKLTRAKRNTWTTVCGNKIFTNKGKQDIITFYALAKLNDGTELKAYLGSEAVKSRDKFKVLIGQINDALASVPPIEKPTLVPLQNRKITRTIKPISKLR